MNGARAPERSGARASIWRRVDPAWWLALVLVASLFWLVHPWYEATDETNDASIYLLTAKALAAGEGYSYLGAPFTIRPPGFSALIAPWIAARGFEFHGLNWIVSAFGVLAVVCLFQLVRARIGDVLALCVAAAIWLNPAFRHMSNQVMSDVPGTALLLACLLVARWSDRAPSARRDILLGLAIGAAAYVRSIDILLAPAIALERLVRAWRGARGERTVMASVQRAILPAIVACAAMLPWSVRNALQHPDSPVDQNFLYSYSTAMWHVDGGDPSSPRLPVAEILGRVPTRVRQVVSALGARSGDHDAGTMAVAFGALLLAAAATIAVIERRACELFACGAVLVLLVYFAFRDRLVLPVYVLALPAAVECASWALARVLGERASKAVLAIALLALAILDFAPRAGWDEIATRDHREAVLGDGVRASVAADARLAAPIGWHRSVYVGRPVYSLYFATRRAGSIRGAEETIDKYGIDTVLLDESAPADRAMLPYFTERYGVRDKIGSVSIIRVRE